MLLGKNRSRAEQSRLLSVQNTLHHCPEGNFGFSKTYITAEKTVHRYGRFHILFDFRGTSELIIRLGIGKVLLKFPLPFTVRCESISRCFQPFGIKSDQTLCHVFRCALCTGAPFLPLYTAHFRKLHIGILGYGSIFRDKIKLRSRDVQNIRPGIYYLNIVLFIAVHFHADNSGEFAYSVVFMHHIISNGKISKGLDSHSAGGQFFSGGIPAFSAQKLCICKNGKPNARIFHSG